MSADHQDCEQPLSDVKTRRRPFHRCQFYTFMQPNFMTAARISNLRLSNQRAGRNELPDVKDLVHWMGAIQAQDYAMSKYAIGVRLEESTTQMVEEAINRAAIIRTHVLRPTWHFVSAEDIRWMIELTANNLNRILASNNKRLELDDNIFAKANTIIEKLLRDGNHLTRKEIMDVLKKKGIQTNDLRAAHIMFRAETTLVVCNGIKKNNQFTYALFDERVPPSAKRSREEAAAELAQRYFRSHGPATVQDFSWWSGMSLTDAKNALELIKPYLFFEKLGEQTFWFFNNPESSKAKPNKILLLPSFDEFLISYKSRQISIDKKNASHAFTTNGIFNPVIVQGYRVIGCWRPQYKKEIRIKGRFFGPTTEKQIQLCAKAAKEFGKFMQKEASFIQAV